MIIPARRGSSAFPTCELRADLEFVATIRDPILFHSSKSQKMTSYPDMKFAFWLSWQITRRLVLEILPQRRYVLLAWVDVLRKPGRADYYNHQPSPMSLCPGQDDKSILMSYIPATRYPRLHRRGERRFISSNMTQVHHLP